MRNLVHVAVTFLAVSAVLTTSAAAQIPLGQPLGSALGTPLSSILGVALPFGEGAVVGMIAAGVIGGVWLARRKR